MINKNYKNWWITKILVAFGIFFGTITLGILLVGGIMGNYGSFVKGISVLLTILICTALYLLPTIIAFRKGNANKNVVLLLNIFFGWTLLVWVIALLRAMSDTQRVVMYVKQKK